MKLVNVFALYAFLSHFLNHIYCSFFLL